MNYLAELKRTVAETAEPFEGFEGADSRGILPNAAPRVPIFSSIEEEKLKNQFFRGKKPPTSMGQPTAISDEKRIGAPPSKPSKAPADDPASWRDRFSVLSSIEAPCPGFRAGIGSEWRQVFDAAHAFLERHATAAHEHGWSALDLFAVHAVVGATRVDCCGALMIGAGAIVDRVERDAIHFTRDGQARGRFFRTAPSPEAVAVWDFDPARAPR